VADRLKQCVVEVEGEGEGEVGSAVKGERLSRVEQGQSRRIGRGIDEKVEVVRGMGFRVNVLERWSIRERVKSGMAPGRRKK
jgi:hypothetical protein